MVDNQAYQAMAKVSLAKVDEDFYAAVTQVIDDLNVQVAL